MGDREISRALDRILEAKLAGERCVSIPFDDLSEQNSKLISEEGYNVVPDYLMLKWDIYWSL